LAALLAASAVCATLVWPPAPALVWNGSVSSPIGLYRVTAQAQVRSGHFVLAWPPAAARRLAAGRRYIPFNVPLVKQVAGAEGARVCAAGEAVFVNRRFVVPRRKEDGHGRPLPWWTGCRLLAPGELFLLAPSAPDSFDGRYFGPTPSRDVIGRARLVWAP
jgi:conjugative transfer signal peptidase TraF